MIYLRNNIIYLDKREQGKRLRLSTTLTKSAESLEFVKKHYKLFMKDKNKALKLFYEAKMPCIKNEQKEEPVKNEFKTLIVNLLKEKEALKYNSKQGYKSILKNIMSFLEYKRLFKVRDFERKHCVEYLLFLQERGNKTSTIKFKLHILKHLLKYALECDIIKKNPFVMPRISQNEKELDENKIKPFDLEQMKELIAKAKGELKNFLLMAFFTGLRTGELLGLKKEDINLTLAKASIKRTLNENGITNAPKTKSSFREIDLLPIVKTKIKDLFEKSKQEFDFLIKTPRKVLREQFKALQESLNIFPLRRLYDTRHSFASVMLSKGEEPMWISRVMLGHSNLNQTYKTYAKYIPRKVEERATFLKGFEIE